MGQCDRKNFASMSAIDSEPELVIITSENEVTSPSEWDDLLRNLRKHALAWYDLEEHYDY